MTEVLTACPICSTPAPPPENKGAWKYCACPKCKAQYLIHRMTDGETDLYYRGAYRVKCPVDAADIRRQELRAKTQLSACADYMPGGSVLEIGHSAGILLRELVKLDYTDRVGVDPDTTHAQAGAGLRLYASLDDVPAQKFDLIVMSHSLEHFNHPRELLERLRDDYSHDETRVMIEVPNAAVCSSAFLWHHPIAFDAQALNWLMDKIGAVKVWQGWHGLGSGRHLYLIGVYEF